MSVSKVSTPRTALICGPYLSGKSSLFEALLMEAGALHQPSGGQQGFQVADQSPEALAHGFSTEMNVASADYLGESWTFLDCPGSVELMQDTCDALPVADIAVVVVEPDPAKAVTLSGYLRLLDEAGVPHIVFINKFDKKDVSVQAMMQAFQEASEKPLVLREIPIREGDTVTGHVDLVSERAFQWEEGKPSSLVSLPKTVAERELEARAEMIEGLADFDDDLLMQVLEDVVPSSGDIYENLARDLSQNLVVPVFFGSATEFHGIHRLMKALRHEAPDVTGLAARQGTLPEGETCVKVFKTLHAGHAGKVSIGRVLSGSLKTGDLLNKERPSGLNRLSGRKMENIATAEAGDVVALTKLDSASTGDLLSADTSDTEAGGALPPLFSLAIHATSRGDDVKLPENLRKLAEEDPSLSAAFDETSGQQLLSGQGDMHLRLSLEKLKNRAGLEIEATAPTVPYREALRKSVEKRVRHRKQSGGHGEFGEVQIRVAPQARGTGFTFSEEIHGGVVPRQYFPAVEAGVLDAMKTGPRGFPLVDVAVTLIDGKTHSVDSSEMAFRKAAAQAMREAVSDSGSALLEPIHSVSIQTPEQFLASIQKIILGRRGQIFGFDTIEGRSGWNEVTCQLPAAEMQDLVTEIRSTTMGVGTFTQSFDHLQEISPAEFEKSQRSMSG